MVKKLTQKDAMQLGRSELQTQVERQMDEAIAIAAELRQELEDLVQHLDTVTAGFRP